MSLGLQRNTIRLVDHDPVWKEAALQSIQALWKIFGPAAKDIQHIGSTAIESIKAKPIIDLAVAVDDFRMFQPLIPKLEREGYTYHGWFLYGRDVVLNVYRYPQSGDRMTTHHIHVVKADSSDWRNHIDFRDYLSANPAAAKAYEELKLKLAAAYPQDSGERKYAAGKSDFINRTLQDAALWRARSGSL